MSDSIQHKLKKVRPPRVKITYDVETGGETEKKELPFVLGVISDLGGDNKKSSTINNNFTIVDPDNIDQYISYISPTLEYSVDSVIEEGKKISVSLVFKSRADFEIFAIVQKIPELRKIYEQLQVLKEIAVMADANIAIREIFEQMIVDENSINKLKESIEAAIKPKNNT